MQHDDELIAQLAQHPGWKVLEQRFNDSREKYFKNLATTWAIDNQPVNQRIIDEKRGFWFGGLWFLKQALKANADFDREHDKDGDSA